MRSGQVEEAVTNSSESPGSTPEPSFFTAGSGTAKKLDRLEDAFEAAKHAVELGPDMLNWRLALGSSAVRHSGLRRCGRMCNSYSSGSRPVPRLNSRQESADGLFGSTERADVFPRS